MNAIRIFYSKKRNLDAIGVYSCDIDVQNAHAIKYTTDTQNAVGGFKIALNAFNVFGASLTKAQKRNGMDKEE